MPRLFLALPLPADVKALLTALRTDLPGARWVNPGQMHLTLHFLGDVADERVPAVQQAVGGLTTPRFCLTTAGLGVFPTHRQPRVLWLGLADNPLLQHLHEELANRLAAANIEVERRTFHPHLTLARLRMTPAAAVAPLVRQSLSDRAVTFPADQVVLYASTLHPGGANHHPLVIISLPSEASAPPERSTE